MYGARHQERKKSVQIITAHCCNSVRVENGAWVLYERPNYLGYQFILTRGDYPDYQCWMRNNGSIRSCQIIRNTSSVVFRVGVYGCPDFSGQMMQCTEDLSNLLDHWHLHEVHSAQVQDGAWISYELPNYPGRQ
ncbi:Beta-crystallin S [Nibea albiflora]|uniref:Beta-crystallin S n=1 Tax=Nibea albiflora TaxID=240163 RepID=A0ACB7EJC3_NIBAL|nr:Beta-crystallin S [Nibea albiflora]